MTQNHAIDESGMALCGSKDGPRIGGVTCPECLNIINMPGYRANGTNAIVPGRNSR